MWHNPNETTERAVGLGVGGDRKEGSWTKFEKGVVGNIGGSS